MEKDYMICDVIQGNRKGSQHAQVFRNYLKPDFNYRRLLFMDEEKLA